MFIEKYARGNQEETIFGKSSDVVILMYVLE